jgi:hypothetical protein
MRYPPNSLAWVRLHPRDGMVAESIVIHVANPHDEAILRLAVAMIRFATRPSGPGDRHVRGLVRAFPCDVLHARERELLGIIPARKKLAIWIAFPDSPSAYQVFGIPTSRGWTGTSIGRRGIARNTSDN